MKKYLCRDLAQFISAQQKFLDEGALNWRGTSCTIALKSNSYPKLVYKIDGERNFRYANSPSREAMQDALPVLAHILENALKL